MKHNILLSYDTQDLTFLWHRDLTFLWHKRSYFPMTQRSYFPMKHKILLSYDTCIQC